MRLVGWRAKDATAEVVRNATSAPGRVALTGLAAVAVFASIILAELRFTQELLSFQERFETEGGYVAIATANETFPGWRCVKLAQHEDVVSVAALNRNNPARVDGAPGALFQTGSISGSLSVWDPTKRGNEAETGHLALGHIAAEELGVNAGSILSFKGTVQEIETIINPDHRNPEISRWLLTRDTPDAHFQECWIEFRPGQLEAGMETVAASIAPATRSVDVRPWRRLDEFARNPTTELADRVQRLAWLPAGILIVWLGWLVAWFRRSELGLYRALGTSNITLWYMAQVEAALIFGASFIIGVEVVLVVYSLQYGLPSIDQLVIAGRNAGSAALLAIALAPLGWLITSRVSLADQIKDR